MVTFAPSSTPRVGDSAIEKIEVKLTHLKKKKKMTSIDERVKLMTSRIKLKGRLHAHTGKNPDSYKYQHFLLACCTRLMM